MPLDFVRMHSQAGYESHLITLYKNTLDFEEDICINLDLPVNRISKKWRDSKVSVSDFDSTGKIKYYKPKNVFESIFFKLRDYKNSRLVKQYIESYNLYDYDIYHFDGGMDLYRDTRFAKELKKRKKKIVCCYFGSDLRTRGIFRELDEISDLNLTIEFDHLKLHPDINYIFFPFNVSDFNINKPNNKTLKIIHSPTNRLFKGTEKIIRVIEEVKKSRDIEFILAEKMSRKELLKLKSGCDIAIDQIGGVSGGTGYGKNSIENLSMGLPTITEFTKEYLDFIPENPFIHCTEDTLRETIIKITDNRKVLDDYSDKGREWAEKYHSFESVNRALTELYIKRGIIDN